MTLYFITGNKNKLAEVQAILPQVKQLEIDLPEIQEVDPQKIIEAKLHEARKHHSGEFMVEDTSLYLTCLNGLPGPLIKWFLQKLGREGLFDLTKKYKNNRAEAKTIIGYSKRKNEIKFFEGKISGQIVKPKAKSDFGWDPIFLPDGYLQTFAEMGREEKNKISMRKKATMKLKTFLNKK
ncbi:MAG: non-canonical purine NTP pyrophosphatase [Patescibacteria group bacterium]